MIDYQGEKFKQFLDRNKISVIDASKRLNVSRQTVYQYFKSSNLARETVSSILTSFDISEEEIWGHGGNKLSLDVAPLYLAADPNDWDNDGTKFEDLGNGMLRMRVTIIPQKAYAGYLRGYQDPEFYEDLPTLSFEVLKEYKGHYLAFEVKGDSMIPTSLDDIEAVALPGWKAVGRELLRHHWQYKLHTHRRDAWIIVHKTDGILLKTILHHDVEKGEITIHSLNNKYPDQVINLNDVTQIFSVVKYIIDK